MDFLVKKEIDWDKFELIIDTNIYSKDILLRAAYSFIDKWYFLFFTDWNNIKIQCQKKENSIDSTEKIIWDYSNELLNVYLRDKIEKENKDIRNTIINTALTWAIDLNSYVEMETKIDNYDWEIENILKELENDPDLKIDEEDIKKLINEIKSEEI